MNKWATIISKGVSVVMQTVQDAVRDLNTAQARSAHAQATPTTASVMLPMPPELRLSFEDAMRTLRQRQPSTSDGEIVAALVIAAARENPQRGRVRDRMA